MSGTAPELPPLREVIQKYDLGAIKALGQHFLLDTNLIDRIARTAGPLDGVSAIEVGPGPGGLTRALLAHQAREVIAIEKDRRCIAALEELAATAEGRLKILAEDALEVDAASLGMAPRRIVANLPYNISTVLLVRWLEQAAAFDRIVVMVQKEVADRLVARPSTKTYGRLSVMTQWCCEAKIAFNVARTAFVPPPKVTSSIVVLTPRAAPLAEAQWSRLEKVVAAAFNQRRKMLRSSLKEWDFDFEALGIPPTARAEELSVEQFCALARAGT